MNYLQHLWFSSNTHLFKHKNCEPPRGSSSIARGYKGIGSIVCYLRADTGQAIQGPRWFWGRSASISGGTTDENHVNPGLIIPDNKNHNEQHHLEVSQKWGYPKRPKTVCFNAKPWSSMTWMIWGYPYDLGKLQGLGSWTGIKLVPDLRRNCGALSC